jgi:asparaginyl-tRNA synthetase
VNLEVNKINKMKTGWIKSIRSSKGLFFVAVTDGAKDFQVTIVENETKVEGELKVGASFIANGIDSITPKGSYEFKASDFKIVGKSDDSFPIQPKHHTMDFFRTVPDLRGRAKTFQAVWRIRHDLTQAIHRVLDDERFFQYYTPIINQADCEGAGETFHVKSDWLDENLTVSGQLHGEVGMMSLGKIYTFSPCFRAEKSATKKHLSEFWMIEPEMAFYDLDKTIAFAEMFIKSVISITAIRGSEDFKILGVDTKSEEFTKIHRDAWFVKTYDEIAEEFSVRWGDDISSDIEKKIIEKYKLPVFITKYPKDLKPFYMKKDEKYAYCFDLIFPVVGELIGGSQREDSYDILKQEMEKSGLDMSKMEWYLNTRKWGSVPHSGFGLGFERLLLYLTGVDKIHDTIPFPVSY